MWLRASGASAMMSLEENKGYYKRLKETPLTYPNPSFSQIDLDLKRTFCDSKFEKN